MRHRKFKTVRRSHEPGDAHAMNFTCFQGRRFLTSDRACGWFVDSLRIALDAHRCALWAFCVMPDHIHLLVFPKRDSFRGSSFLFDLKKPVTKAAIGWVDMYAPSFFSQMEDVQPSGKRFRRFWQRGGGYDRNLSTPALIYAEIDYIHNNPVKAGLVDSAADWRWSSARQWLGIDGGLALCDWSDLPPRPMQRH